ncbi:hypothetical protein [Kutzneria kofuensis]|uniref:hypothetical protein n=1 Tax=Kutzneria kofuensis TaxID=103725 RepID=UPI0031E9DB46
MVALLVGLFGCIVWALPIDEDRARHFLPFPFAVAGIVLSIMCLNGRGRGGTTAAIGLVLSSLALVLGIIMASNELFLHAF